VPLRKAVNRPDGAIEYQEHHLTRMGPNRKQMLSGIFRANAL
jgi:hypothetical protein